MTAADWFNLVRIVACCLSLVFLGWLFAMNYHLRRSRMTGELSLLYLDMSRTKTDTADRMYLLGRSTGVLDADLVHLGRSIEHVSKDLRDLP